MVFMVYGEDTDNPAGHHNNPCPERVLEPWKLVFAEGVMFSVIYPVRNNAPLLCSGVRF